MIRPGDSNLPIGGFSKPPISLRNGPEVEQEDKNKSLFPTAPAQFKWRRGNFAKCLLASASNSTDSSLSPGTIQKLVNPMRFNFGLPSLCLDEVPSKECQDESPSKECQDESPSKECLDESPSKEYLEDSPSNHTENTENKENEIQAVFNFKELKEDHQMSKSNRNILDGGSGDNNSLSSFPEVAARIPSSSRKIGLGGKTWGGMSSNTGKGKKTTGGGDSSTKGHHTNGHKTHTKEKKSSGGGSGWKFSSEHVQNQEYLVIKLLGKGGCGEVSLVIEKETRQLYALKKVSLAGINEISVQECINEVEMLEGLRDTDLVVHIHSWEFNKAEKTMKIVMEHGQCDLNSSILSINASVLKLKYVWEKMLSIVDIIHQRGIVHSDLKPANFIWAGDNLKIIDFGIASRLQQDHTSIAVASPKGTVNFMSPESIQADIRSGRAKISPKSDIWSLGCILYLMIYKKTPFEHINNLDLKLHAIRKGQIQYPPVPLQLCTCSDELLYILRACFNLDYKRRPSTAELLSEQFLRRS